MSTKTARSRTTPSAPTGYGATGAARTTTTTAAGRQSSRVAVNTSFSDGAVWQEKLVVCEGTNSTGDQPVIMVRSYYRNLATMEKAWDEPPSGAAAIVYATPAERHTAEEQRTQLELTLQMIPADTMMTNAGGRNNDHHHHQQYDTATADWSDQHDNDRTTGSSVTGNPHHKKKGFLGRFRKGGGGGTGGGTGGTQSSPYNNKNFYRGFQSQYKQHMDVAKDVNLQRAIAQSIQETRGGIDDVELAMALSLSVAEKKNQELQSDDDDDDDDVDDDTHVAIALSSSTPPRLEDLEPAEEELFQRALERSQREAVSRKLPVKQPTSGAVDEDEDLRQVLERSKEEIVRAPLVASLPKNYGDYVDESSSHFDGGASVAIEHLSEDELELKMPAKPRAMTKFDPYGKK